MKILMFGWEFPPHNSGGLGVACFGMAKALSEQNMEIIFVLPKKLPVESDFVNIVFANTEDPRISLRIVDSSVTPYKHSDKDGSLLYCSGTSLTDEVRKYGIAARKIARQENFDVIHAHDWLSMLAGVEAKKVSGKPLIVHVHATEFDRSGGIGVNEEVYSIEQTGMSAADKIITVSQYTKDMLIEKYGIDPGKIEVVHNGLFQEEVESSNKEDRLLALKRGGTKVVLFVGRITLQKGPDYFIQTAKEVLRVYPNVIFLVAGSGDMEYQIIREASRLGISDKIMFMGFLRGEEHQAVFRAADIYVMPSVSEPFGLVALEALSHGTPVIISKQSGVGEVLQHALKVDFWDTEEMANQIVALLENKSLHDTIKENGYLEAIKQTWEKAAHKIINIYRDIVSE